MMLNPTYPPLLKITFLVRMYNLLRKGQIIRRTVLLIAKLNPKTMILPNNDDTSFTSSNSSSRRRSGSTVVVVEFKTS